MNIRIILLILFSIIGCSAKTRMPIVETSGEIKIKDKNLPEGTRLLFNPVIGGAKTSFAVVDKNGEFKCEHLSGVDGIEIGNYTLSIRSPEGEEKDFYKKIDEKYLDGATSIEITKDTKHISILLR